MERRVAAGATAALAVTWLVVDGVRLSSGLFGRETRQIELRRPSHSHSYAVTFAVCAVVVVVVMLGGLLVLAERIRRGSRRSERVACLLITFILALNAQQAIKEKTNIGLWLGVALDLVVLTLIVLALRASGVTHSSAKVRTRA